MLYFGKERKNIFYRIRREMRSFMNIYMEKSVSLSRGGLGLSTRRSFYNFARNISKISGFDMAKDIYPVDFPRSSVGQGANAWIKATSDNIHSIVYYRGDFTLTNMTPFTFNRMKKTGRKKIFYLSHYKTFYDRGDTPYTVHFMWPMWVGRPPKGILTQNFCEWRNPWNNNSLEKFYVGEFAFVNMLHIPLYANNWELLDFTKSPWDSVVGANWWKDHFIKREGFDHSMCFGYAIYCFTPGFQEGPPSYVPLLGCEVEQQWKPESDPYKRVMVAANRDIDKIPDHWFWEKEAGLEEDKLLNKIAKRDKFVKKWTYLGFHPDRPMRGLELQDPLNAYLPDGKKKDPDGENIGEFFKKAEDPASYYVRANSPPVEFNPIPPIKKWKDILGDDWAAPNPWLRPRTWYDPDDVYSGSDDDDESLMAFARDVGIYSYEFDPVRGWAEVFNPRAAFGGVISSDEDSSEEMLDLTDLRKIDKIIYERAEHFIKFNESLGLHYEDYDTRMDHIRRIERSLRINMGFPPTPVHTPPLTDDELSSDDEGYYSASWVKYGDISSFKHFWDEGKGLENEIANDLMEDWAQELRDERGSRNDNLNWKVIAESNFEGLWPARTWPWDDYFAEKYRFWDDPRHEE